MTYVVEFSALADKQLSKLPVDVQERIVLGIKRCRIRPHHFVKRLVGSSYFRLRVGDYRVILDIQGDKLLILVLEIGHRKNIYKNS